MTPDTNESLLSLPYFLLTDSYLKQIDVQREWIVSEWKFVKMTMDKSWMWLLEMEVSNVTNGNDNKIEFTYQASLVLSPDNYNTAINRTINKYNDAQREMGKTDEDYLNDIKTIHYNYNKEAGMYGIFDFKAVVLKFERKVDCTKIKFLIGTECSEHFSKNFEILSRSSLVLKKI